MDQRMTRKRKRLFTLQQVADRIGCHVSTVSRMEQNFLTDKQRAYLDTVGYCIGYYPRRKGRE